MSVLFTIHAIKGVSMATLLERLERAERRLFIYPAHVGYDSPGDGNNCAVRALANVKGEPYELSFKTFEQLGRRRSRGANVRQCHAAYIGAGGHLVNVYGVTKQAIAFSTLTGVYPSPGMTLGRLIATIPKTGRYVAIVTQHALAIVDGNVIDLNATKAHRRVTALYKFD